MSAADQEIIELTAGTQQTPFLDEQDAKIRTSVTPWDDYFRANLISESELNQIRTYDHQAPETLQRVLSEKPQVARYAHLLMALLQKLGKPQTVQYLLLLIDDLITGYPDRQNAFHELASADANLPFSPLLKLLTKEDDYTVLKASKVLTSFASTSKTVKASQLDSFFAWIDVQLKSPNETNSDTALRNLQNLLRIDSFRTHIFENYDIVSSLITILKKGNQSFQTKYQVIFNLWLLSFDPEIAAVLNSRFEVISPLLESAKKAVKEKVVRISVATLRNMLEKAKDSNLQAMMDHKLLNFGNTLSQRKWTDEEIKIDLDYIVEVLGRSVQELSSFDEFAAEVRSGELEWTPVHRSEVFWKQNASRLNENDFELVKALGKILNQSTNNTILAVACHDIGQYVKHTVKGKGVVQELGIKQRIMELMIHENSDVQYNALLAVQKYMSLH